MEELDTYSIETDHTVLLSFRNGRKRRVDVERLGQYLRPGDLEIVRRAMKLRRDFIRSHMPKAAVLLLVAGLAALLALGGRTFARLFGHPGPSNPGHTIIVHSQAEPEPAAWPEPASPGATPKISRNSHTARPQYKLVAQLLPAAGVAAGLPSPAASSQPTALPPAEPSPTPAPSTSPAPQTGPVAGQTPADQPASTPAPAPEQGQVLSDSTGPAAP